jgi:5-(carboxyamino)imidazole ribonucleotide mutase
MKNELKVSVIMGSDSDLPVMEKAINTLKEFNVPFEVRIISAHRSPTILQEFISNAQARNVAVIIAGAGGSAHLPGVIASYTTLPVIGVPIKSKSLNGLDSLLSIVQMPSGVPVATVAIDGAKNAALLAIQILSVGNGKYSLMLNEYKKKLSDESMKKNEKIKLGH